METVEADQAGRAKQRAAVEAAGWLQNGMVLGLGTGSTVRYLLEHIASRRAAGEWRDIVGIPTSSDTATRAAALGIPLGTLSDYPSVDLTIDGADEVDPELHLIKGLGGALLREKIVASCSAEVVIVADVSKQVRRLGTRSPLPVEVDPFGAAIQTEFLSTIGGVPTLRRTPKGEPFITDGGNWIYDCAFAEGIADPFATARALQDRVGIMEHGLFLSLATAAVIADGHDVLVLRHEQSESTE